jgi:diacylglycerol kinase family enzyme
VLVDGRLHWFVAHLVARKRWWRGRVFAAMNAEFIGRWDVAPRSHPNDGILDTFDVTMSTGDRWKARSRLPTGTHVPHPDIAQRRVDAIQLDVDGLDVWLDGENIGPARRLSIRIEPDALTCVV